jgi:DNA repair exonuclease SbcCD ATPase subunit
MSALSFKINAETDKLKSFITMLERLRQVLAEIPDSTKEFDVINRKIGEMEARVEQTMRKIAQMEQQAMDAASKATASATTGTAGGSSTPGTAATQAETAAYHELIEELRAVNASKRENVALISQYEAQIKRLKSKIIDLNKTESSGIKLTQDQKASRLNASVSIEEYKQALSRARQELANQIKLEQVARGSIDEVSQALGRMRTIYRSLNESERGSNWGQNLLKNIEGLDAKVKELDASMGVHTRNVGNYASGFNMLGFQIQQVARELPSLAYGPQIFFPAISNNLPMLADEIARAKKSVDELKKAGQTFTPVWKQIASSIFSWQTLLVAGVTVLTLYGKEITNWVASLFKGKTTIDASAAALERFNSAMAQGSVSAQSELTKLNLLYRAATDLSKPYEERAEAVKKLQDIYPAYFGNMAAEQVMVGNAVGAYENLRDAIIEVAEAKAAQELITEDKKSIARIKKTGNAYTNYSNALKEYRKEYDKAIQTYMDLGQGGQSAIWGAKTFAEAKTNITQFRKEFISALSKLGEEGNTIWKRINEDYEGDVDAFIAAINAGIEKLSPAAEKLYTALTPDELNAKAEKARQEAENAAKKAASDQERNLKELTKQLQKLRDDALQAEVDSMKEGTAKKLAQIDLDYQKRARAIQEAEKKLLELQEKEIDAQYKNDTSSERFLAGQQMIAQYKGNVNHLARPLVEAAELVKKGWEDAGEGIATVFSSQYGILDAKGKVTEILVTPILPNGDILSPQELEDYIYTQLEGAQNILAADTKGLVIATNVAADGSAGEKYHELQEVYYADNIKAAEGVRIYTEALKEFNKEQRNEDWDAAFLSEAGIENTEEYLNKQLQAWNEYYMKYGTLLEKIQATKSYYDKKISETEDAGAVAALEAEKNAALATLEVEGGTFVDDLVGKTEEYITRIKDEIKAAISALEGEYNKLPSSDSKQGEQIRNQINVLRAQLSALQRMDPVSDDEHSESFKKWQKLYNTLTKIEGQFNDIGEAAGGAMGEVISTASKITTSSLQMINSIKTLAESSAEGIEATGEAAATTIQKVERASVILAIIQAALQIIQSIASLFGDTETSMERNIREAQELNEELRVMNERARLNADIFSTIFGEDAFGSYTNNVKALSDALNDYQATMDKITKRGKEQYTEIGNNTGLANLLKTDFVWESVSESVANMMNQVRHSTWFRDAKYKKLKDVVPELFEESGVLNMQALKEFVEGNSDTFKHLSKENQTYLKELVNNWETYEEAVKAANDYLNGLFGDLGSTITDALVDSFEKGINAADAFGEAAGDMLKNLAKQVLYTATIAPAIEDAQKKIDEINRDAGLSDEQRFDALAGVVGDLLDDVMAQQQLGQELWDRLQQAAEERGIDWDEGAASQQATSRGFQTMSQDTGDELNGRFTDIQGKVTDIRGYVMAQTQSIIGLLTSMANIETAMYACVQVNNELLRYAVMTYMEIVEINGSTKNIDKTLVRIEEGINSIKKNTENI